MMRNDRRATTILDRKLGYNIQFLGRDDMGYYGVTKELPSHRYEHFSNRDVLVNLIGKQLRACFVPDCCLNCQWHEEEEEVTGNQSSGPRLGFRPIDSFR